MTERTITIKDDLKDRVEGVLDEIRDLIRDYIEENSIDDADNLELNELDNSGAIHELIDGAVPVYYSDIDALWYLYKDEFTTAYENAGIGSDPLENNGMAAIYCYISEQVYDNYADVIVDITALYRENMETAIEAWKRGQDVKAVQE